MSDSVVTVLEETPTDSSPSGSGEALFRPVSELMDSGEGGPGRSQSQVLKRYASRLELLNEIHRALADSISLEELLELILGRAFEQFKPEEGIILLRRPGGELYRAAVRRLPGVPDDFLYSRSLVAEVTEKRLAALVLDARTDARFADAVSLIGSGVRSILAAPLLAPESSPGVIMLNSRAHIRRFAEEDMELLVTLASVAAMRIRYVALGEEAARKRVLERDLGLAREIQLSLLPDGLPETPGYALYASNEASRAVSGDFYEVENRRDGKECLLMVADVSGKGIAASLLTASLEALAAGPIEVGRAPDEICERVSRRLKLRSPTERYATAFVASLELETGTLCYANAGHNPAILVRTTGEVERLRPPGIPLGLMDGAEYTSGTATLGVGDNLLIYTDGITEAANPEGEEYELERLEELCRDHCGGNVSQLAAAIERDMQEFVRGVPFADDRTLVIARRLDPAPVPA